MTAAPAICAACRQPAPACDHADAIFAGVVAIDTISEPGSYAQHLRDVECMRVGIGASFNSHDGDNGRG
jgi:hypothetical protein